MPRFIQLVLNNKLIARVRDSFRRSFQFQRAGRRFVFNLR